MNNIIQTRLDRIAHIELSSIDKKSNENETNIALCNYVDVYKHWAITKANKKDFMIATAKDSDIKKLSLKKGQVAITKDSEKRDDIGISTYIADTLQDVVLGYHCALITPNPKLLNGSYLNAFFHTNMARKHFENQASGSGQRYTLTKEGISCIKIPLPKLEYQESVGHIFSLFDRKISLNNSIISKLEEMAKIIYGYWFLQFDFPNSEGKPYASSGGTMKYSKELGREIPIDWEVTTLGSLLERNSSAFDYSSTQPTIDLSVMPQGSIMLNQLNSSNNFATNLFEMKEGDILFGSIRPYLKKAGIAPCNGVYAGTVYSYRPKNEDDFNFAIITMCRNSFFNYAVQISQGTKMPVVKSENLMDYKLAYNPKISKQFNQTIQLKKIICSKAQENQKLAQLRDWLLPMLMNGQVRVEQ
ncbi:restriction endonuclease subunit S [Helicobacter brantae]|uniref:Type I restriction modification DNA specificity domain-containing protein n=1 Tax=Helicobacter brantae TaxID=375927 RepID=A0A3D8IVU5_9HELI|nr:restriction endonuclease subunit S [Helicobacter brantae]RDU68754.1 hypothetical protein CQA58_08000 [Helicobacter brantae]